ncbi:MAG: hypothetical protein R6X02_33710 [Enhygromyxa sp.]
MRLDWIRPLCLCLPFTALLACGDDVKEGDSNAGDSDTSGDGDSGDGDSAEGMDEVGDGDGDSGDGDSGDGDGDSTGDGDGDSGDGDGDSGDGDGDSTGDGDGDSGDGDGDSGDGDGDSGDGDGDSGDGDGDSGDGDGDSGDGDGDPMEFCTCAANTDLIYVLSDNAQLWSYNPESNQFAQITASLGCPVSNTFSMSVDRNGIAYVMFQNDAIYAIDVNNPNMCMDPGYVPGQLGFNKFGMGFVSNSLQDPCDKLYAHSWNGQGGFNEGQNAGRLGRMDVADLQMEEIGFIDYNGGELTGTGDGRLFAFAGSPAKLVQYNKDTAEVIATEQLNMSLTNAFAFAFHGGGFYMFTESNTPGFSKVTHYDYEGDKSLTQVVDQAPIRIVGAGVSTCAPIAQ